VSQDRSGVRGVICNQSVIVQLTKQVTLGLNVRQMIWAGTCRFVGLSVQIPGVDVILDYEADRARRIASNIICKDARQLSKTELNVAGWTETRTIK
jgi:hypothetical protein